MFAVALAIVSKTKVFSSVPVFLFPMVDGVPSRLLLK